MVYQVGQRVEVTRVFEQDDVTFYKGDKGVIARIGDGYRSDTLGIEWSFEDDCFHECDGACEYGNGYYISYYNLDSLKVFPIKIGNIGAF